MSWLPSWLGGDPAAPSATPTGRGLLDYLQPGDKDQALYQALGQIGGGLLAAGARSYDPGNAGRMMGQAFGGFAPAYQQGLQGAAQRQILGANLASLQALSDPNSPLLAQLTPVQRAALAAAPPDARGALLQRILTMPRLMTAAERQASAAQGTGVDQVAGPVAISERGFAVLPTPGGAAATEAATTGARTANTYIPPAPGTGDSGSVGPPPGTVGAPGGPPRIAIPAPVTSPGMQAVAPPGSPNAGQPIPTLRPGEPAPDANPEGPPGVVLGIVPPNAPGAPMRGQRQPPAIAGREPVTGTPPQNPMVDPATGLLNPRPYVAPNGIRVTPTTADQEAATLQRREYSTLSSEIRQGAERARDVNREIQTLRTLLPGIQTGYRQEDLDRIRSMWARVDPNSRYARGVATNEAAQAVMELLPIMGRNPAEGTTFQGRTTNMDFQALLRANVTHDMRPEAIDNILRIIEARNQRIIDMHGQASEFQQRNGSLGPVFDQRMNEAGAYQVPQPLLDRLTASASRPAPPPRTPQGIDAGNLRPGQAYDMGQRGIFHWVPPAGNQPGHFERLWGGQ